MDAVFQAYRDIGMRATVSGHVIDRTFLDSIPFAREVVPADLQREVDALPGIEPEEYLAFARTALQRYHNLDGRLRFMMAPSAPQRCSPELMHAVDALARQYRTSFHTHIVETKVQAVTGPHTVRLTSFPSAAGSVPGTRTWNTPASATPTEMSASCP